MKKRLQMMAAVLCFSCLLGVLGAPVQVQALAYVENTVDRVESQEELNALNRKLQDLENQKKAITSQLSTVQSQKKQYSTQKAVVEADIGTTKQEIALLEEKLAYLGRRIQEQETKIEEKEEQIQVKEGELEEKQANIAENTELLKGRVRANYMSGSPSLLSVLFGSDSFFDMLANAEMMSRMVAYDDQLLKEMEREREELEQAKIELENTKADLEDTKAELEDARSQSQEAKEEQEAKKEQLDKQISSISAEIQTLSSMEAEYYANQAQIQQDMKEAQAEIDRIYASLKSSGEFVGGEWGWPLPNYSTITSYFGWRFNNTDYHTGIDISGANVYGKNIVASNTGKVAFVNNSYVPGKSYGKYLIVDHGGGYSTLYAHCSSINVSVGQTVARGEAIAQVGSTGWSTGPHLHFEIRINGKAQNPLNYL